MKVPPDKLHTLRKQLIGKLWRLLLESTAATRGDELVLPYEQPGTVIQTVAAELEEDLLHFADTDPASLGDPFVILDAYSSFAAVLHHRLANAILTGEGHCKLRGRVARWIADRGKVISGVDIHPAAKIGRRFALDHALGTVIGETCEIGDDCYILGGVVLGSRGISANPTGKRHPTLGNGVQIGAYARVLGPVTVGDHAFVASHCVVTTDIPPNARLTIVNQIQVEQTQGRDQQNRLLVFGACAVEGNLMVMGFGFQRPRANVLDEQYLPCHGVTVHTKLLNSHTLLIKLYRSPFNSAPASKHFHLQITDGDAAVVLIEPQGFKELATNSLSLKYNQFSREPFVHGQDAYAVRG